MAICKVLFKTTYRVRAFVICLIGEERQGPIAEMILTRLSRAYYHTGGGFSIGSAGSSMRSLFMAKLNPRERAAAWRRHQDWLVKATPYEANMEKEIHRMKMYMAKQTVERKKALRSQIDFTSTGFESASKRFMQMDAFYQRHKDSPVWQRQPEATRRIADRTSLAVRGRQLTEDIARGPLAEGSEDGGEDQEEGRRGQSQGSLAL